MASNDDLSEQLGLMMKLNTVVERMSRSVDKIEESYQTQINTLEKLLNVINTINTTNAVNELSKITASLKEVTSYLNKLSSTSDGTMSKIISDANKAAAAQSTLSGAAVAAAASVVASAARSSKGMSAFADSVQETATGFNSLDTKINKVTKTLSGPLPTAAVIGAAALHGFGQGLSNIVAVSKATLNFTSSLAGGLTTIGASILSIPLKIFSGLVNMAANAEGGGNELLQALENLRKEMGDLNKSGSHDVLQVSKTFKGFSETGLSTWRVLGTMAERIELVTKLAVTMGATFGELRSEFVENAGALIAFQKGLGFSDEQMKAIGDRSITMGSSLSKMLLSVTKQTLALGQAFDIDQKLIGKDIAKAIVDVRHFGSVTVKEIGQASVYARKLGLELDKIVGTLDAFETFDSAAENAAKLSQSFGVSIDAFQLMEAQNPADQLDMLRKQFRAAGVDAASFSRQQLKLLQSTTGLDEATAKQAFSLSNSGISLDEIKKKSEAAEKKTLTQAEAMSKLADSIERLVKSGGGLTGSFFDMFVKGFFRGIQSTQEFRQMIMFIKMDLREAMYAGVKLGKTFANVFPGVKDFFGGIRDFFEPKRFREFFKQINIEFTNFFNDVATGKHSFPELMKRLQSTFFNFFDSSEGPGKRVLKGFTDFMTSIANIVGQAIPWIAEKVGKGLQKVAEFLSDPGKFLKSMSDPAKKTTDFASKIVQPIAQGLVKAWENPELRQGLSSFLDVTTNKLKELFTSARFKSLAKDVVGGMLATLLGPTILQGALAGLSLKIGGSVVKQIGNIFKGGGASGNMASAGGKMAAGGLSKMSALAGPGALLALGASIGKGVTQYTDQITSSMDRASKTIAAGATGIVDALTLGLLPDDLTLKLANTFAKVSDSVFSTMESAFGVGFVNSIKRRLTDVFEVLGNVYNFFAKLFTGDPAEFTTASKELGLSLVRFAVNAFEFMFAQLPMMVLKFTIKIESMLINMAIKIGAAIVGLIAEAIDKISPVNLGLRQKTDAIAKDLTKSVSEISTVSTQAIDSAAKAVANSTQNFNDTYLRSSEERANAQKKALETQTEITTKATENTNRIVEKSLSETLTDIKAAKEIKKELSGADAPDIKTILSDVKNKMSGVDFKIVTEEQANDLTSSSKITEALTSSISNIQTFFENISKIPESVKAATSALKRDAIKPAIDAVANMVTLANQLDTALSDGNLNKVDIKAKLTNVANSVGLGAKAQYTVTSKPVNLTVNLTVSLNAEDMEKALIMRGSSIIRDRINFATGDNAGRKGSPAIPETYTNNLQKINAID